MKAAGIRPAPGSDLVPGPGTDAEALFREARRRQRKRYLAVGLATAAMVAVALGTVAGLRSGGHPARHRLAGPAPARSDRPRGALSGPVLGSRAGSVLMWPVNFGPDAYLVDLSTGRVRLAGIPGGPDPGDYDPYLVRAGRWVVYVEGGGGGTLGMPGDLRGRPRVLGRTFGFAPAAALGRVWLVSGTRWDPTLEVSARLVPVVGGRPGPTIRLPSGSSLVEGTDAGLLLISRHRDLELWAPGRGAPVTLAHLAWPGAEGFAANTRLVAYGTGCRLLATAATADPAGHQLGYQACRTLRAVNLITGARYSFPAPPGTAGWVPPATSGFNMDDIIAPGNTVIAAEAIVRPSQGLVRVFVLRLGGARQRPVAVPRSVGFFPMIAWSSDGTWLLYQGPGKRLWAYRVATGTARSSSIPCCFYTVMVTIPPPTG